MSQPLSLNLRHLEAAVVVSRLGTFTAAAAMVNLSQPTLTQGISKLEEQIGARLFARQSAGCVRTEAGDMLIPRLERALSRIEECCSYMRRSVKLSPLAFPQRLITLTQLRAFLLVERHASFSAAARELGLSQPAVHRAARELELILGIPLLVKAGSHFRATTAGERLAREGRLALAEIRSGLDDVASLSSARSGRLILGTLPLPRSALLPQALSRFYRRAPTVEIVVMEGPYKEQLAALRQGELDLLIGALRPSLTDSDVQQIPLFEDDLFVVARKDHPICQLPFSLALLAQYPWVIGAPDSPMRQYWESLFRGRERPKHVLQCGSVLTTRGLLLAGDWLALMSMDQFQLEKDAGLLTPVGGALAGSTRQIGLTMRSDWRPSAAQSAFVETLEAVARERRPAGGEV